MQEAIQSKHPMVQYHALGLLHQIKQHDRLAVSKLVQSMSKSTIRSPHAHCLLIRFCSSVITAIDGPFPEIDAERAPFSNDKRIGE